MIAVADPVPQRVRRTLDAVKRTATPKMAVFHRAGHPRLNVFPVGDTFLFEHYIVENAFDDLRRYSTSYDDAS